MIRAARSPRPVLRVTAAPFYRRLLADLIDLAILAGIAAVLWRAGVIAPESLPPQRFDWIDFTADLLADPRRYLGRALVLVPTVGLLYGTVLHTLLGRTVGELLLGLRLVDGEGAPAGPFRSLLHGLGTLLGLLLLLLGYVWGAVDHRRQTVAEYLSGTLLVVGHPETSRSA